VTDWESADDRNSREKISRARQAAEDLFKPVHQAMSPELASISNSSSVAPQAPRQPRVLAVAPRVLPSAKVEVPAKPKPTRQKQALRRHGGTIPPSQLGRVRALASYGMTRAQVAELYGVTIEEIDRIIKVPAAPLKSR
jgi:hypothetical protein